MFLVTKDAVVTHVEFEKAEQRVFVMDGQVYDDLDDCLRELGDDDLAKDIFDVIKGWYISKWNWEPEEFRLAELLNICPYELQYGLDKIKEATEVEIEFCGIVEMKEFVGVFDNLMETPKLNGMSVTQLTPIFI
jgi:hypothetical protein